MHRFLALCLICSCSAPQVTRYPVPAVSYEPFKIPESEPDPTALKPEDDWAVPIESPEDVGKKKGLLISEGKALRALEYKTKFEKVRGLYLADAKGWAAREAVYLAYLEKADRALEDLKPTWWERNLGSIAFLSGFVLGAAISVGIAAGVGAAK